MENLKYELVTNDSIEVQGTKLLRIRALINFGDVRKGDIGGYVEHPNNLDTSVSENAWVYGNARVYGDACVYGTARVSGDASVSGNASVSGDARVSGNASVLWFTKVGSTLGTLTAFLDPLGEIIVTRGCFLGTLNEFRTQVIKTHVGTMHEKAYLGLANYIEFHFTELHPPVLEIKGE